MARYLIQSAAFPTTAASAVVASGTAIKTLLQWTAASTRRLKPVAWGISFAGTSASAEPVMVELLTTGTVAGTGGTSITPQPMDEGDPAAVSSTAAFQPSAEGTITTARILQAVLVHPTSSFGWQFPLGREPVVKASDVLRIRIKAAATVNCYAWVECEE